MHHFQILSHREVAERSGGNGTGDFCRCLLGGAPPELSDATDRRSIVSRKSIRF